LAPLHGDALFDWASAMLPAPRVPVAVVFPECPVKFPDTDVDDTDRRLLELLQEDASRPLKTLAAAVALSRSSVRDRIARMQADGVIRRYTVELAPLERELSVVLMIRLSRTPDPEVVRGVVSAPEVVRCYSLSGDIDLLVELAGRDAAEVNRARDRIALLPGVAEVVTSFVLNRDKAPAKAL
jgi:Lrp/AsnC family transcriptional regulator, leucine-responsive regulatory protein